jgi:hypothetical protein
MLKESEVKRDNMISENDKINLKNKLNIDKCKILEYK